MTVIESLYGKMAGLPAPEHAHFALTGFEDKTLWINSSRQAAGFSQYGMAVVLGIQNYLEIRLSAKAAYADVLASVAEQKAELESGLGYALEDVIVGERLHLRSRIALPSESGMAQEMLNDDQVLSLGLLARKLHADFERVIVPVYLQALTGAGLEIDPAP